jgi:hypothetical protein
MPYWPFPIFMKTSVRGIEEKWGFYKETSCEAERNMQG